MPRIHKTRVTTATSGNYWQYIWECTCGRRSPRGWNIRDKAVAARDAHQASHRQMGR